MSDLFSRPSFEDYYQTLKKWTAIQAETFSFFFLFLVLSPAIKSAPDHDTSVFLDTGLIFTGKKRVWTTFKLSHRRRELWNEMEAPQLSPLPVV